MKLFSSFALILTLLGPALSSAAPIPSPHSLQVESPPAAPGSESASLRVLESTAGRVVLELTTPGYRVETVETPQGVFAHPVVDGLSDLRTPGLPQLPQQSVLVAVPPGAAVRLEVVASDGQATAVTNQLLPAPRARLPQDVAGSVDAMAKVSGDEPVGTVNVYEPAPIDALPGGIYPQAITEMGEAAILRGYQVVPVRLFPVQADLGAGTLTLHKTLQVTVHFDFPAGVSAPTNDPTRDPYYEPVLRASIINYEQARAWRQNMPNPGPVPSSLQAGDFKFVVDADGLYRVTYTDLVAAGFNPSGVNPQQFALSQRGNPVAVYVAGEADGRFDPGDYVEFYGQAWHSDYTSQNAYWLRTTGPAGPRMSTRSVAPANAPLALSFRTTYRAEQNMHRWTQHLVENRAWWWERYTLYETPAFQVTATHAINLPGVATQTQPVGVRVALASNTNYTQNPDHHALFFFNDPSTPLTEATWDGRTPIEVSMTSGPGTLLPGANNVIVRALFDMGTAYAYDIYYLDWVDVTYDRRFLAESNQLHFSKETAGTWRFPIDGFSGSARAFDVTNPANPVRLLNGQMSGSRLTIQDTITPDKRFFAVADTAVRAPQIQRFVPPPFDLRASSQRADYLIIAHASFMNAIQPLAALHTSRGLQVKTLDVAWLYDEFNWGIPEPDGIRNFLDYAYHQWSAPAPSFVLLVGDTTFNPKGYNPAVYGAVETVFVPSFILNEDPYTGEVASDNHLVTVDGSDILADIFVGRLVAQSVADVQAMVAKNLSYAQAAPYAPWRQRLIFAADNFRSANGTPDPAGDFERSIQEVIDQTGIDRFEIRRAYYDPYPNDDNGEAWRFRTVDDTRAGIAAEWNNGGAILNYVGHAFIDKWGEDLWRNQDTGLLTANVKLPVAITMGCLDGYFDWPNRPSLAETFNRYPGAGTIAHWSPTGLGVATGHDVLHREFYHALQQDASHTLAVATETAKVELYAEGHNRDLIHTFMIFGDPALRIGLLQRTYLPYAER